MKEIVLIGLMLIAVIVLGWAFFERIKEENEEDDEF